MICTVFVTVDVRGDRPYVSTTPPSPHLDRRGGEVKVFQYELFVPDAVKVDQVFQQQNVINGPKEI